MSAGVMHKVGTCAVWYDRMFRVWYVAPLLDNGDIDQWVPAADFHQRKDAFDFARQLSAVRAVSQ